MRELNSRGRFGGSIHGIELWKNSWCYHWQPGTLCSSHYWCVQQLEMVTFQLKMAIDKFEKKYLYRKASIWKAPGLFGHCLNSFWPPSSLCQTSTLEHLLGPILPFACKKKIPIWTWWFIIKYVPQTILESDPQNEENAYLNMEKSALNQASVSNTERAMPKCRNLFSERGFSYTKVRLKIHI